VPEQKDRRLVVSKLFETLKPMSCSELSDALLTLKELPEYAVRSFLTEKATDAPGYKSRRRVPVGDPLAANNGNAFMRRLQLTRDQFHLEIR
jgi:hypothetical protein